MTAAAGRPGRVVVASEILATGATLALIGLAAVGGIDSFTTPLPAALGSGVEPAGGHCASPQL